MARKVIVTVETQSNPTYPASVAFGGLVISLIGPAGSVTIPSQTLKPNSTPGQPYVAEFDNVLAGQPGTEYTASYQMIGVDGNPVGAPGVSTPTLVSDAVTFAYDVPVSIVIAAQ